MTDSERAGVTHLERAQHRQGTPPGQEADITDAISPNSPPVQPHLGLGQLRLQRLGGSSIVAQAGLLNSQKVPVELKQQVGSPQLARRRWPTPP